jgi:hypothetical protein
VLNVIWKAGQSTEESKLLQELCGQVGESVERWGNWREELPISSLSDYHGQETICEMYGKVQVWMR